MIKSVPLYELLVCAREARGGVGWTRREGGGEKRTGEKRQSELDMWDVGLSVTKQLPQCALRPELILSQLPYSTISVFCA